MLFARLAQVSQDVAAASARSRKIALLAELFRDADPDDVPIVIPYLAGRLPQGRLGVGWRVLSERVEAAPEPRLSVQDVDALMTELGDVSGAGSQAERKRLVGELMGAATEGEQRFLFGLVTGEVRQGALDAVATEGLAQATGAAPADVRRAVMLAGGLQDVAQALLARGTETLDEFRLTVGRPVLPMLAHSAGGVGEALDKLGTCAVEEKLDGIRVQVHRDGDAVHIYTRTLDDITDRLPEVTDAVREFAGERFILDGEVIALGADGRPRAFQDVAGRVGSRVDVARAAEALPVSPCSSMCCTSTGGICWICRSPGGTNSWHGSCRSRCGYGASWSKRERARTTPYSGASPRRSSPTPSRVAMKVSCSRGSRPRTARAAAARPG